MKAIFLSLLLLCLFYNISFATQDGFLVSIQDTSVKVIAPDKAGADTRVVISNNTLTPIRGKIVSSGNNSEIYINLPPSQEEVYKVSSLDGIRNMFIPLAPPFQEVELIVGKKSYEIPSKK